MSTADRPPQVPVHAGLCRLRPTAASLAPTTLVALLVLVLVVALGLARPVLPSTSVLVDPPPVTGDLAGAAAAQLLLRTADGTAVISLDDTAPARALAAQLPLWLRLRDPMGQAAVGRLPQPLDVAGAERVLDPEAGGVFYWPAGGDLAVFHDDLGQTVPPPGLVRLGTVTAGLAVVASVGRRPVTLERR